MMLTRLARSKVRTLAALATGLALSSHAQAASKVSILDGRSDSVYAPFFSNAGYAVKSLTTGFNSTDIAGSQLVVLSFFSALSPSQLNAIDTYVDAGGRLVLASDAQGFEFLQAAENGALSSLGSSITNVNGGYDAGLPHVTGNIGSSIFTKGVTNVQYAYTSAEIGGTPLVTGNSGQVIVSEEQIQKGYVFALSDTNLELALGDSSVDNGQLFLNFAAATAETSPPAMTSAAPEPSAWLLLLGGVGAMGMGLRRSRQTAGQAGRLVESLIEI